MTTGESGLQESRYLHGDIDNEHQAYVLKVEDTERDCSDFMDLMGYKKIYNNTSTSTVPATNNDVWSTSATK